MPTITISRKPSNTPLKATDWRCSCCRKLLGQRHGASVLIRFARGPQYRAVMPVTAICRSCHTLNELS